MPYVNIKLAGNEATKEQKAKILQGVTDVISETLGKNPKATYVVIEEIDTDNWGVGGESLTELRKKTV